MTTPLLALPQASLARTPRGEVEIIRARRASATKWRKRRRLLRLRAALFGRERPTGPAPAPRPSCA